MVGGDGRQEEAGRRRRRRRQEVGGDGVCKSVRVIQLLDRF